MPGTTRRNLSPGPTLAEASTGRQGPARTMADPARPKPRSRPFVAGGDRAARRAVATAGSLRAVGQASEVASLAHPVEAPSVGALTPTINRTLLPPGIVSWTLGGRATWVLKDVGGQIVQLRSHRVAPRCYNVHGAGFPETLATLIQPGDARGIPWVSGPACHQQRGDARKVAQFGSWTATARNRPVPADGRLPTLRRPSILRARIFVQVQRG